MIAILTDADLKRADLQLVPIEHIELSDFTYYSDDQAVAVGKAHTILFKRDGFIKVFKHFVDFPNEIRPADEIAALLIS